jgi:hypothetical protein
MDHTSLALFSSMGLLFSMLIATEAGRKLGRRVRVGESETDRRANGLIDGAIFALLGLLIAFTFSGAASRFDHRKELVIKEANAIGTAYLRLDLLPAELQPALRGLFRRYVDARLAEYQHLTSEPEQSRRATDQANDLLKQIWRNVIDSTRASGSVPATTLLTQSANEMIDIAGIRAATRTYMHPPTVVFVMLFGIALLSAVLAGYAAANSRRRTSLHVIAFATVMAATAYVILDIEYPRFGFIRIDDIDQLLVNLRKDMG